MKKIITIISVVAVLSIATIGFIYQNNQKENDSELIEIYTEENPLLDSNVEEEKEEVEVIQKITVEIKGEVTYPGVYQLDENARVIDLIHAAGGLTGNAVTNNINLAKILKDEMVVVIYNQNDLVEQIKTEYVYLECTCPEVKNDACIEEDQKAEENNNANQEQNNNSNQEENNSNKEENKKISINNASLEELMTLNGIGEKTATKIIEYRKDNPFETIEDIKNVSGIGESLYEKIKDSITI